MPDSIMTPEHDAAIRASWAEVEARADVIAAGFHARLLELHPAAAAYFTGSDRGPLDLGTFADRDDGDLEIGRHRLLGGRLQPVLVGQVDACRGQRRPDGPFVGHQLQDVALNVDHELPGVPH